MDIFDSLTQVSLEWLPVLVTLVVSLLVLLGARRFVGRKTEKGSGVSSLLGQLLMLSLSGVALVAFLLALPIDESARGQLLSLLGFLLTAAIALASTTFLGNALAGMMLRAIRNVRPGDFVRVGEHFGRVSEQGLLHTELQTEDRDLTTLPNLHLVTHPFTVVRSSGTVLSASVSLGYDVPRRDAEEALLAAGRQADLKDPFVQIVELGDFSVEYRLAGILEDVKYLVSSRSLLRACMLDALHAHDIEVVSPSFMNQRAIPADKRILPAERANPHSHTTVPIEKRPEALIFDKADEAQAAAGLEEELRGALQRIEQLEKERHALDASSRAEVDAELAHSRARVEELRAALSTEKDDDES